jgi:ABC-type branched-subunit amino acid transport system substrate-binding protein
MHSTIKGSGKAKRLFLILLTLVSLFALLMMACGEDEEDGEETPAAGTPAAEGALKIGILFDFTGDLAEFGPNMENGAKLAAKQVNDAGGILGSDIELKRADSQTSATAAVPAAQNLVDAEGVQAIVGSLSSGVTLAVAEAVTVPEGVIQISPASTSPALSAVEDNDFLFRTTLSDAAQGLILAQLADELGYAKVSTMYVNNPYGEGLSENFAAAFEELGGEVPAQVPHEQEQASYLSELQKATADKPDALAALSYPQSGAVYLKEAIENDLVPAFLFCDGTKSEDIVEAVGAENVEGMFGTVAAASPYPEAWVSDFEEEYTELPPLPYIAESYDAVIMIALGAAKAGSLDPAEIRDAMRTLNDPDGEKVGPGAEGIKKALELIADGEAINYEGASGFSGWDENGDVPSGFIEIWKYEGGEIVTVRTEPVTVE